MIEHWLILKQSTCKCQTKFCNKSGRNMYWHVGKNILNGSWWHIISKFKSLSVVPPSRTVRRGKVKEHSRFILFFPILPAFSFFLYIQMFSFFPQNFLLFFSNCWHFSFCHAHQFDWELPPPPPQFCTILDNFGRVFFQKWWASLKALKLIAQKQRFPNSPLTK